MIFQTYLRLITNTKTKPMNEDKIVVYESFNDPIRANIVKSLLESYEIECFLSDENMTNLYSQYSPAIGGVKLNVFEKDIDRINVILKDENVEAEKTPEEDNDQKGVSCPKCNSTNVAYGGSLKKKFGFWSAITFSLISIFLFIASPFYQQKSYHCFDCGHEFKKV